MGRVGGEERGTFKMLDYWPISGFDWVLMTGIFKFSFSQILIKSLERKKIPNYGRRTACSPETSDFGKFSNPQEPHTGFRGMWHWCDDTRSLNVLLGGNLRPSSFCSDFCYLASSLWIWFRQKINKLGVREVLNIFWLCWRTVRHLGSLQIDESERCLTAYNVLCLEKTNQPLGRVEWQGTKLQS